MRLIDADALLKHEVEADRMGAMLVVGKGYILNAPEVDAVPVVRCKECGHYETIGRSKGFGWCKNIDRRISDNFYCANGKRLEVEHGD
jgi:hypothetical protein